MNFIYGLMKCPRSTSLPLAMFYPMASFPHSGKWIQVLNHQFNTPEIIPSHFTGKLNHVFLIQSFVP